MSTTDSVWADLMRGVAPFRTKGQGAWNNCFQPSPVPVLRERGCRGIPLLALLANDPVVSPAGALPADVAERRESLLARKVPSIFFGHVNTPAEDPCFKNT